MSDSPPLRSIFDALRPTSATVENVEQLPPAPDGRRYRYEVSARLDDSVTSPPSEDDVRGLAEKILDTIDDIEHPNWRGADELYIQLYAPDRELGAGACGTAHWLFGEGFESVSTQEYLF